MTDGAKKPKLTVIVDGKDVTDAFDPRLIAVSVHMVDGGASDTADLTLDDRDGSLRLPRAGADISIRVEWSDGSGSALEFNGKTDEPESIGSRPGGRTLNLRAMAADMGGEIKENAQAHKDDADFGDVAKEWGQSAGLDVKVAPELAKKRRDYWDMKNENFMAWGQRIAEELGATFKIMGKTAVFTPRNSDSNASGQALTNFEIRGGDGGNLLAWQIIPIISRANYRKSVVRMFNGKKAEWTEVEVEIPGSAPVEGQPRLVDRRKRGDETRAQDQADANAAEVTRAQGSGTVVANGDGAAQPQASCNISGARPGVDGTYRIAEALHTVTRRGSWIVEMRVEQPQGSAGTDGR